MKKTLLGIIFFVLLLGNVNAFNWNQGTSAYWNISEASGNLIDSRNFINMSPIGSPLFSQTGVLGNAVGFNSNEDHFRNVSGSDLTRIAFGTTSDFSVNLWINISSTTGGFPAIFTSGNHPNEAITNSYMLFKGDTGTSTILWRTATTGGGVTLTSTGHLSLNAFHMVTLVRNNSGADFWMFIDNVLNVSSTGQAVQTAGASNLSFGNPQTTQFASVILDEFGIFNFSFTSSNVSDLYNNGTGCPFGNSSCTPTPQMNVTTTLNSPSNATQITSGTNQQFNATIANNTFSRTNSTLYVWFANGTTFRTSTNTSFTNGSAIHNISSWVSTDYFWNILGVQGNGGGINSSFAANNFTLSVRPFNVLNQTFNTPVIEQSTQNFQMTLMLESGFSLSTVLLNYNNTNYTGSFRAMNSTTYNVTAQIITPSVNLDTNKTFFWIINFTDATSSQSISSTQLILDLSIDSCSANTIRIMNVTMVNEETQAGLNKTGDVTSIKINVELYNNVSLFNYAFNFSRFYNQTLPAEVCISDSIANSTFFMNSIIEYDATGYAHEFYHIQNYSLNTSGGDWQNITLYDLNDSQNQNFKIIYKDESFLPVANALVQIQRKYVDENAFKVVEIPKTDTNGETVAHLEIANAVYTFSVVKNGRLLSTFNDLRAICANQVVGDCIINLNTFASSLDTGDFTILDDFTFTISYNNSTRVVSSIFTIPSGATATVLLNVTVDSQTGVLQVCSNSLSTSSGTVSCTIPSTYGNQTVVASIYKNGDFQGRAFIKLDQHPSTIYTVVLVFLSIFLMMTLIGIGVSSDPKITGLFLIMGAVLSIALNLTSSNGYFGASATILWFVIAIVLVLIKSTKR